MFDKHSRKWIADALASSPELRSFVRSLGLDPDDAENTLSACEAGIYGDARTTRGARDYLASAQHIIVHPVDHALLASNGIDTAFVTAFLHAFGPGYETGDWDGDEAEDSVRGLLGLVTGTLEKPVYSANITLDRGSGIWNLQTKFRLDRHVHWRSDFRGDHGRDEPDILLEYQLPDGVISGLCEAPLRQIIQHPVLNQFDLTIEQAHEEDEDIRLDITCDARMLHYIDL